MFDVVSTFPIFPFPMVLMWCGHINFLDGNDLGDITL
jgi:hypothetical protein